MRAKAFEKDLQEFDAWSFCKTGGILGSQGHLLQFPRLTDPSGPLLGAEVSEWEVRGRVNAKSECVLTFSGHFAAQFPCVICNGPVHDQIRFFRNLILKTSESEADAYDQEALDDDTDVVCCAGAVNLRDWLEDEMLLACPMFSRHETCEHVAQSQPPEIRALQEDTAEEQALDVQRPFANLSDLLKARKK